VPIPEPLGGLGRFQDRIDLHQERYRRLATEGQSPIVLFLACSDARVSPKLISDSDLGDLFVVRSLGNLVPSFGSGEMAVGAAIRYAVLDLGVEHIVVCGHTDCAAIHALSATLDWRREPHITQWIEHARLAKTKVEARGLPSRERPLTTVRESVPLQLEHVRTYDPVPAGERDGNLASMVGSTT
jgi:carbonic anhydrase